MAYGPEQILITLSVVGAVATWYSLPIAGAVLILLAALIMSYRQIIYAYPKGGRVYGVQDQFRRKMGIACRRLIISRLHTDCRC